MKQKPKDSMNLRLLKIKILIKACYVTSFWLLQLQSSGISLTQRLGTHSSITLSHLPLAWSEQMRKPEPTRPELQQPPKRLGALPRRVHIREVPVKEHPRRTVLSDMQGSNTPDGPLTTYDTRVCPRVSNDSSTMDKPTVKLGR